MALFRPVKATILNANNECNVFNIRSEMNNSFLPLLH